MSWYAPCQSHMARILGYDSDAAPVKALPRLWQQPEPPEETSEVSRSQIHEVTPVLQDYAAVGLLHGDPTLRRIVLWNSLRGWPRVSEDWKLFRRATHRLSTLSILQYFALAQSSGIWMGCLDTEVP